MVATETIKPSAPRITPVIAESLRMIKVITNENNPLLKAILNPTSSGETNRNPIDSAAVLTLRQQLGNDLEVLAKSSLKGTEFAEQREFLNDLITAIRDPKMKLTKENIEGLTEIVHLIQKNGVKISAENQEVEDTTEKLIDGTVKEAVGIFERMLCNSGSVLGMLSRIPGVLPEEVKTEEARTQYVKDNLVNDDFRNCIVQHLLGKDTDTESLNDTQAMCFRGFQFAMTGLKYCPKILLDLLPAAAPVLGFFASHIPFYGFINMGLLFLGNYQKELQKVKDLVDKFEDNNVTISSEKAEAEQSSGVDAKELQHRMAV